MDRERAEKRRERCDNKPSWRSSSASSFQLIKVTSSSRAHLNLRAFLFVFKVSLRRRCEKIAAEIRERERERERERKRKKPTSNTRR